MTEAFDLFTTRLAEQVGNSIGDLAKKRVSALMSARAVKSDADVGDLIALSHFILTGSGVFPDVDELHRIEVRNLAGETVVSYPDEGYAVELGGHRFTQAQWEAVQAYCTGTSVLTEDRDLDPEPEPEPEPEPDPAADAEALSLPDLSEVEPAPSEGDGWQGHRG